MTVRCTICKGTNVEYTVWFNPNTNTAGDHFGSWNAGDNTFCSDCGENTDLEDVPTIPPNVLKTIEAIEALPDPDPCIGAQVTWTSQSAGVTRTKRGEIVEVVPAGARPRSRVYRPGSPRTHESYVVRAYTWAEERQLGPVAVDGGTPAQLEVAFVTPRDKRRFRLYWPRVKQLSVLGRSPHPELPASSPSSVEPEGGSR